MPYRILRAAAIAVVVGATALTAAGTASPAQADSQASGFAAPVRAGAAGLSATSAPGAPASPGGTAAVTTSAIAQEHPADDLCAPAPAIGSFSAVEDLVQEYVC
jgi:hypothetical protein